jgi:hypothetical protein
MVVVFIKVPIYNPSDHTLVRVCSLPNHNRFEQEQDPLGRVLVRIVLTADLMDDVVTECHISKSPCRPWLDVFVMLEDLLDVLRNLQMV